MRKESFEFLKRLMTTLSPSGFEKAAQEICRVYVAPYVDEVYKDVHGNQFAVRNAGATLRVMLDAHIDEVGLMVKNIDDEGFIGFVPIGSVDPAILGCQRVKILGAKGSVGGVIGRKPPHVIEEEERGKAFKMHDLWIDIAARSKKDAERYVAVGDPIVIDVPFVEMANGSVCARGFDDRMGAFVIIEAMRLLAERKIDCAVYCVTAVQEEIGCRGARTASYGVNPDVALAVEFGWTTDHPSINVKQFGERQIGKGPLISRGPNINPIVEKQLRYIADKKKIPYQIVSEPRGTPTDANPIQLMRGGVATALIRVPGRYIHSPVEVMRLRDAELAAKLIAEWIFTLESGMDFIP